MAIHSGRKQIAYLPLIVAGSLAGNVVLWYGLSRGANQVVSAPNLPELVVERVVLEKPNSAEPKKEVYHPIRPKAASKTPPPVEKIEPQRHENKPQNPPRPGAHNKVILAKPVPRATAPSDFKALTGGNAKIGAPTNGQTPGNAVVNPAHPEPVQRPNPSPPAPASPPNPIPAPPVHQDPPPPPPIVVPPKREEPAPPPPPPKSKGVTQDATPTHQVNPEIPESLKSQTFKSHVRVRVTISADGNFEVTLRTSSGNTDIDKLVLDALNRWKWKPALKDGEAVDSVQLFRFEFSVE